MRVLRWAFFGVLFALLPIFANCLSALTRGRHLGYVDMVGRGELLLVAAGIAAAAAGELVGREDPRFRRFRLVLTGTSLILLCLTSYWFADVAAAMQARENVDHTTVSVGSSVILGLTLVTGVCCIVVSELE